ncbi:ATP-binding protein [Hyalangium versicolor]|uniref:ATP-binding protein n=1 Tax=Hyalangium versicolor TaxID=2861190 RepID=UPI001CCC29A6|nr:ATP-binding protein [Hyalangium versicolor]
MHDPFQGTLPPGQKIDLTNCDREPIHIPGHIQAHGVLLALDPSTLNVLQASDNTLQYLGVPAQAVLGKGMDALLGSEQLDFLSSALRTERLEDNPLYLFTAHVLGSGPFHVIVHLHGGLLLMELEPTRTSPVRQPDFYELMKRSVARFQSARTVSEFCQMVAEEIRRVSGYDRVMIYKFQKDWSGHVIAEDMARDMGLPSYLDLHYPASDIPSQARALFLLNTVRMLPDAQYAPSRVVPELNPLTGKPLDMSFAFLRGASQMYTEYLINMGVRASLTLAISAGDQLWGLVACHHYSARQVPYDVRTACEFLSRVVSLQVVDKGRHEETKYRERMGEVHRCMVQNVARQEHLVDVLTGCTPGVREFVECGGAAVLAEGECRLLGNTPSELQVRLLVEWLKTAQGSEIFATDQLPALYPDAKAFKEAACGLLALPISRPRGEYVLWFRPETIQTVNWAGDPYKPVEIGPMGDRLTPRKSFELWSQTVEGRSLPWVDVELEAARRLRESLTEIVFRRSEEISRLNLELFRSNQDLDSFAYVASHDLKEPLRGIYNYATFLTEDYAKTLDDAGRQKLATVIRLSKRMQVLIDSLLHFSRLGKSPLRIEPLPLGPLVDEALENVESRLKETGAVVSVPRPLPTVHADHTGLIEVYSNLLSNALKYNDKPERKVEVGYVAEGEPGFPVEAEGFKECFYVKDNGIGIPENSKEEIFRIFKRLHPQADFGGGTGAGLTIVKKVIERHGGRIWLTSREGEGTTFYFTLGRE